MDGRSALKHHCVYAGCTEKCRGKYCVPHRNLVTRGQKDQWEKNHGKPRSHHKQRNYLVPPKASKQNIAPPTLMETDDIRSKRQTPVKRIVIKRTPAQWARVLDRAHNNADYATNIYLESYQRSL